MRDAGGRGRGREGLLHQPHRRGPGLGGVDRVCAGGGGYSVHLQDWDFRPGKSFVRDMQEGATLCRRTLAVLSPDYFDGPFSAMEWEAALTRDPTGADRVLVTVRVRECDARAAYERALPLYEQVGDVLGQANCIHRPGRHRAGAVGPRGARAAYERALALYERIPEPYSIGWAHRHLARLADSPADRRRHVRPPRRPGRASSERTWSATSLQSSRTIAEGSRSAVGRENPPFSRVRRRRLLLIQPVEQGAGTRCVEVLAHQLSEPGVPEQCPLTPQPVKVEAGVWRLQLQMASQASCGRPVSVRSAPSWP